MRRNRCIHCSHPSTIPRWALVQAPCMRQAAMGLRGRWALLLLLSTMATAGVSPNPRHCPTRSSHRCASPLPAHGWRGPEGELAACITPRESGGDGGVMRLRGGGKGMGRKVRQLHNYVPKQRRRGENPLQINKPHRRRSPALPPQCSPAVFCHCPDAEAAPRTAERRQKTGSRPRGSCETFRSLSR